MKELSTADVESLVQNKYQVNPLSLSYIGGGFYGRVFLVKLAVPPYEVIIKCYLQEGLHRKEQAQLALLAKHGTLLMPRIYEVHDHNAQIPFDALFMEYIDGVNGGGVREWPTESKLRVANEIVDNLIAYHQVVNPAGFGEIGGAHFEKDWRVYYKRHVEVTVNKARIMVETGKLPPQVHQIAVRAYKQYEEIFSIPVEQACLIHGDYNTWNILLHPDLTSVAAAIDPYKCSYADPELDLYQLNQANGKELGLLELYRAKRKLSPNAEVKMALYRLFTEIMHYYDADAVGTEPVLLAEAEQLAEEMERWSLISKG